ncbi:helix-turn-helix domain-containing protein [Nonomuraea lactucae]|uniref:helix-turn-helix domain-containing protein n=1 Tax=Nonomuraea lactucae TaxID=2249762 RepID=UPI001963D04D|nr:helix-turn-helix transcriptional regulator [Nonomuraea lactucae]
MTAELDYRWHLRKVMAGRGMHATSDLRPLLAERGLKLSQSQVYRLVAERPVRLNLQVLMALLDILGCAIDDLIEPVPNGRDRRVVLTKASGRADARDRSRPKRPKRARVLPRQEPAPRSEPAPAHRPAEPDVSG